ncbi:hypothetical protein [Streptomyces sp. NPDC013455]|uniref:hypothetical protein n=1 Tax=Streptomyces sp. NPDC013455 TaxID=3155605 RepID=UPI0033C4DC6B
MGTQITDTGARAVLALRSMEANAFRVSQVTTRLLDDHTDLPDLLAVRPQATGSAAQLDLQARTIEDARTWAAALGGTLRVEDTEHLNGWSASADVVVDGVTVHVCAFQHYSAEERAERGAAAVVAA